jgi:hypothetical protein
LFSIFLAISFSMVIPRSVRVIIPILSLLVPAWNLGSIYAQASAYEQHGSELRLLVAQLSNDIAEGRQVREAFMAGEFQYNILQFFSAAHAPALGLPVARIESGGLVSSPFTSTILNVVDGHTEPSFELVTVELQNSTPVTKGLDFFGALARRMGSQWQARFDSGAPWLSHTGELHQAVRLMVVRQPNASASPPDEWRTLNICEFVPTKAGCVKGRDFEGGLYEKEILVSAGSKFIEVRLDGVSATAGYVGLRTGDSDWMLPIRAGEPDQRFLLRKADFRAESARTSIFLFLTEPGEVKSVSWRHINNTVRREFPRLGAF